MTKSDPDKGAKPLKFTVLKSNIANCSLKRAHSIITFQGQKQPDSRIRPENSVREADDSADKSLLGQ